MEKEFIPHKLALELKELGFDEPCFCYYKNGQLSGILEEVINSEMRNVNNEIDDYISAPLYQQAFRWFREKYGLVVAPQYFTGGFYCFTINNMKDTSKSNRLFTEFETYEEAELACLKKLIEIVKNK